MMGLLRTVLPGIILFFAQTAFTQDYPAKPIKFVLPVPPGAGTDTVARLVGERLQAAMGQPVLVEHRAGAGGNLAAEAVYRSPPDGYTMLFSGQATLVINKSLYGKTPMRLCRYPWWPRA